MGGSACSQRLRITVLPVSDTQAGENRHACIYLALGDYLVTNTEREPYDPDEPGFIYPDLESHSKPGKKIGDYIKDLRAAAKGARRRPGLREGGGL